MEIKSFKKNIDLEKTIKNLPPKTFYIKLGIEKRLFKTITKIFIFNENDVKNYLNDKWHDLLELFNIKNYQEEIILNGNKFYININCKNENSILIGKKGYTISALQNLLITYLETKFKRNYQIVINVNNYLNIQKQNLKIRIYEIIKKIRISKEMFHFESMPNNQRKIIHEIVKNIEGISSFSEAIGYNRHVVIRLEN
ncbi:protein jag [Spiroplasma endosymbiont of Lariophagus distinguendus]|uniref:Jag family protein n=1 Tax=Spiroplasma endosymbiont of Lariophagus distinguendus TaxID=2935082 RepID=UPI00207A2258|nr:R3H domain-containing nucleic acid-binding protein [Spiroplasma endosymbiont of Lariophagus distinguendus]